MRGEYESTQRSARFCLVVSNSRVIILATTLLIPSTSVVMAQGELQELRNSVREDADEESFHWEESSKSNRSRRSDLDDDDEDHDSFFGELLGRMFISAIEAPFIIPAAMVGDDYSGDGYFPLYPYEGGIGGYMMIDAKVPTQAYPWSLRIRGEYTDDFDGLQRFGGQAIWESSLRFGLDTSVDYRQESLAELSDDSLWTGDLNVVFRFAQGETLTMRAGLGLNWLTDSSDTDLGFNFTYGGDLSPAKPWVISGEIDWGTLGHAGLFHARTTVGICLRQVELFAGYDYFDVGDAQLDGFVSGLRWWY